jgi:hypothetical protein
MERGQKLLGICYPKSVWFSRRDCNFIRQDLRIFTILPLFHDKDVNAVNVRACLTIAIIRMKLP